MNSPSVLLAKLEVEEDQAVRCQAPGCNHTVWREVHVVRMSGTLRILGSSCFKKLFERQELLKAKPWFTTKAGRRLTAEERAQLVENTERLIAKFESQFMLGELESAERASSGRSPNARARSRSTATDPLGMVSPTIIALAKQRVREVNKVDPDLPGWRSLLVSAVKEVLRER